MAGIQLSGLASGLDTSTIISKFMELEKIPIYSKEEQISKIENEKAIWTEIDVKLKDLQSQAKDLTFNATFGARTVESSDEKLATAVAQNNTAEVSYILEDIKLAQAGRVTSGAKIGSTGGSSSNISRNISVSDKLMPLNQLGFGLTNGTIKINNIEIEINSNDSLDTVMDKINNSNANVNVSFDSSNGTLKFESKLIGTAGEINFESDSSSFFENLGINDLLGQNIKNGVNPETTNVFESAKSAFAAGTSEITSGNIRFSELTGVNISSGSFKINDKTITINENDTLNLVINKINNANASVKASYDEITNQFKIESVNKGSTNKIKFGEDTTGFLNSVGLDSVVNTTVSNGINSDYQKTLSDVAAFDSVSDTGFFTINGYTFEVDKSVDTLESVIKKINSSNAGVTLFYDEDNADITMVGTEPGKDIVLENDTANFLKAINLMNQSGDSDTREGVSVYQGTKASVKINGVQFTKDSNKFVVNGVNIELKSNTTKGETVKVEIKSDVDKAYKEIEEFINSYNDIVKYIEEKTAKGGDLQGNSTANNMLNRLRREMTSVVNGAKPEYNQLSMVGIKIEDFKSNKLVIDSAKLKEALKNDPTSVQQLFTKNVGTGFIKDELVDSGDGNNISFSLKGIPLDSNDMTIKVGNIEYTLTGPNKIITNGDPGENDVFVDLLTGKLKFGTAPTAGAAIYANYNIDNSKSSDGLAIKIGAYLKPFTTYNGTMGQHLKTFDNRIKDMNKWIASMTERLNLREEAMRKQYLAMEQAMSQSQSTGSWLSSQVSSLSSSNS